MHLIQKIANISLMLLCFSLNKFYGQNPAFLNYQTTQTVPSDETRRATSAITLSASATTNFKYGAGSAGSRLTLQISEYKNYVENGYMGINTNCSIGPSLNNPFVGEIDGKFEVSSNGSATYKIPIKMSPGTAGVQPNITLVYASGSGSGIMGLGWSVSGLSAITRGNKNPYLDGKYEGVNFTSSDVYNLDGNRLLLKSGTYGSSGSTYDTELASFADITANGTQGNGPQSFIITDKNGVQTEYGTNGAQLVGVGDNTPLTWLVSKVTDEFGNYMTFSYKVLSGETVIERIKYTGNNAAGIVPYNEILFEYQPKTEKNTFYIGGREFHSTSLLTSITSKSDNNLVKKYVFEYIFSLYTLLSKVHEINMDGTEIKPTEFCWDDPANNNTFPSMQTTNLYPAAQVSKYNDIKQVIPTDLDGDGFSDFVIVQPNCQYDVLINQYRQNLGTSNDIDFSSVYNSPNQIGAADEVLFATSIDDNLDGKQEVYAMVRSNTFPIMYLIQKISNLSTTGPPSIQVSVEPVKPFQVTACPVATPSKFYYDKNDYTGDGVIDELIIDPVAIHIISSAGNVNHNLGTGNKIARPCDFNGDGKLDIVILEQASATSLNTTFLTYNSGSLSILHNSSSTVSNSYLAYNSNVLDNVSIGDYNGDGKTDILYLNNLKQELNVRYSTGTTLLSPKLISTFDPLLIYNEYNITSPDINSDGISDIIFTTKSTGTSDYIAYLSVGDLFTKSFQTTGKFNYISKEVLKYYPVYGNYKAVYENISVPVNYQLSADLNGDGVYDVTSIDNQFTSSIINNALGSKMRYIQTITTALDRKITISYSNTKTFFDGSKVTVYNHASTSGSSYSSPIYAYNPGKYVCSYVTIMNSNLINLSSRFRYMYGKGLFHSLGKGFLGFESFTTIDLDTYIGTELSTFPNTTYFAPQRTSLLTIPFQNSTYNGIKSYYYTDLNSKSVSVVKTDNTITSISGKQIFVTPSKITSFDFLNSTSSEENYTYDITKKGNLVSKTIKYGFPLGSIVKTYQESLIYTTAHGILRVQKSIGTSTQTGETPYIRETDFVYDNATGHLTSKINDISFGLQSLVTTYSNFNPFGIPTKATVSAGDIDTRITETLYDTRGRFIIKTINPIGNAEEFTYDSKSGSLLQKKDISGLISEYYYDGLGRLIRTKLPDGTQNTISYEWVTGASQFSKYTKTVFNEGQAYFKTFYNHLGQESATETVDFNNNKIVTKTKYHYLTGLLEEKTEPYFEAQTAIPYISTKFTYDPLYYRLVKTENYKVTGTTYINTNLFQQYSFNTPTVYYPVSGNTIYNAGFSEVIDHTGKKIRTENNLAGQATVVKNIDASSQVQTATHEYHSNGNKKSTILTYSGLGYSVLHTFSYNNLGQQSQLSDPTSGIVDYTYNTLGELLQQTDANGTFNFTYDNMGRLETRTGSTSGATSFDYVLGTAGRNQIEKITGPNVTTEYTYDNLNRQTSVKETVASTGKIFTASSEYDKYSNVTKHTYAGGYITKYLYASNGELTGITDNNNSVLWQLNNKNAIGQITDYSYGNGINTIKTYNYLHYLQTIEHGGIHKQTYSFDNLTGNLLQRDFENLVSGTHNREKFTFDALDRLNQSKQTDPAAMDATIYINNTQIDIKGNITHKDDAGDFLYGNNAKPYSLTGISNPTPLIPVNTLNTTINDLKKVSQIAEPATGKEMNFIYGNDDERIKVDYLINSVKQYTRYYQPDYDYEENATGTITKENTYIYAPTGLLAVNYKETGTGPQFHYALTDHLGSPVLLTKGPAQTIIEEYSFDSWGRRRNPVDWSYIVSTPNILKRGFTFHEHIDEFGLINMNGRIYDPALGRFIQPDNYVQAPDYIQNYNRYSYVFNNPLKYTDPSGNVIGFDDLAVALIGGVINLGCQYMAGNVNSFGQGFGYFITGAASGIATYYGGPIAGGAVLGLGNNLVQQASSGQKFDLNQALISTGMGAAVGYFSAVAGAAISPYISSTFNMVSNPVLNQMLSQSMAGAIIGAGIGGTMSAMSGGDFAYGMKMGAITGFASGMITGFASGLKQYSMRNEMVNMERINTTKINDAPSEVEIKITTPNENIPNSSIGSENNLTLSRPQGLDGRLQIDRINVQGTKRNYEISNMTQQEVMSKLTDIKFYSYNTKNGATVYTTPGGGYITSYPSSYYKGGNVPTIMYNNNGFIVHLRFINP
jgi:RHS repeat-associated protein